MAFCRVFSCVVLASMFLVFSCLDAFSATCPAGQYRYASSCHTCVAGCYCEGGDNQIAGYLSCSQSNGKPKFGAIKKDNGYVGVYLCPSVYPNSSSGASSASKCYLTTSSGSYVASARQGQVSCPAGYKCSGGTTVYYGSTGGASKCSAGTYSTGGKSSCSNLSAGYYGGEGATSSTGSGKVSAGYFNSGAGTTATPSDYGSGNNKRGKIAGGYYSNGGGTSEKPTGAGNGCVSGQQCGKVNAGYYSSAGGTSATPTSAGNGCVSGQQCGKCASNAESSSGSSYCTCKTGYSIGGGASTTAYSTSDRSGNTCAKRTYTLKYDLDGGSGTKPANQTCTYGSACNLSSISATSLYKAGYKLVGWSYNNYVYTTSYTASGTYSSERILKAKWEKCKSGTYHGNSGAANTCFACPTAPDGWGSAISVEGATSWADCQTKKSIESCDTSNSSVAVKQAKSANEWGVADTSNVAPKAGYYKTGSGESVQCVMCPAGEISWGGKGVTSCTKCEEGQATNTEHTSCLDCNVNQYVDNEGYCAKCPAPGERYDFIDDKSLGMCPVKLKNTSCDSKETKVIYTYSKTESKYVRKEGFKVVAGEKSVVKPENEQPSQYNTTDDYCTDCKDKYRVKDENGNWVCGYCSGGYCLSEGSSCITCRAGYSCPYKIDGHLSCSNSMPCNKDEYAEKGSVSCTKCATGYSTFDSGPADDVYDGSCTFRSFSGTYGYGTACTSNAACKLMPAQFCWSSNCGCAQNSGEINDDMTFMQKRDTCKSSFSLGKHVKLGQINKSVIMVRDKKKLQ